jgi:hypothetical protein
LLGASFHLNLDLKLVCIWGCRISIWFEFEYEFDKIAIKNIHEEKLIYLLLNPNLFIRFI